MVKKFLFRKLLSLSLRFLVGRIAFCTACSSQTGVLLFKMTVFRNQLNVAVLAVVPVLTDDLYDNMYTA